MVRKLKVPRKFSATQPEVAIRMLTQAKLNTMKEEIERLKQKQTELASKLKRMTLPTRQEDATIEVITQEGVITSKITNMINKADQQIEMIAPLEDLLIDFAGYSKKTKLKPIKIRIITEKHTQRALTRSGILPTKANQNNVEIKQTEELPYNLLITDNKEALWKGNHTQNENTQIFWTDGSTQITILKAAFENLWQKTPKNPKTCR
jgi:sugar-specific transcriptional regulator TrmB